MRDGAPRGRSFSGGRGLLGHGAYSANGAGHANGTGQAAQLAEVRRLIRETLAELKPHEHEVIELSVRRGLDEAELAAVLEVSWSRAHALAAHARERLEKALDALLIARTGRESCPELAVLLAGWDGRLTVKAGRLTAGRLEHCETCANLGTARCARRCCLACCRWPNCLPG